MRKGIVVSDMHMFSNRSTSARNLSELEAKIAVSDICVFNGDIFDFRWTNLPSVSKTVEQAVDWLKRLLSKHSHVTFYFVCGNHDSHPALRSKLHDLSSKFSNFIWHPYYLRIGPHFFLHGDIVDSNKQRKSLDEYRKAFHRNEKTGFFLNLMYNLLIASQLHKIIVFIHKREEIAPAILEYLRGEPTDLLEGVENIFFGHTHVPFKDFQYEGIAFHNSGSMIRGLESHIFEFEVG